MILRRRVTNKTLWLSLAGRGNACPVNGYLSLMRLRTNACGNAIAVRPAVTLLSTIVDHKQSTVSSCRPPGLVLTS